MALQAEDRKQTGALVASWNGSGTAPANSVVVINHAGSSVLAVQISGTFVGTLQFEGLVDEQNGTWFAITGTPIGGGATVTSTTATGQWFFQMSGLRQARVRCSAYTSGTANVYMNASAGSPTSAMSSIFPAATAIADATANPTVSEIATFPMIWNGATWDRWKDINAANNGTFTGVPAVGLVVLDTVNGQMRRTLSIASAVPSGLDGTHVPAVGIMGYSGSNFQPVTVQAAGSALPATNYPMQAGGKDGSGNAQALSTDTSGRLNVATINGALPAGANALGSVTVTGTPAVSGTVTSNQGTQNGAGTASWPVQGAGAAGAALAGNPVRVGLSDNTNAQDWVNAVRANAAGDGVGVAAVSILLKSPSSGSVYTSLQDARSLTDNQSDDQSLPVAMRVFNGLTYDRLRSNVDVTLLASAARTTTQTGSSITAYNCQAIAVTLDVTAIVSTCSLTVTIGYVDPASGKVVNLLTSAVIAAVSTTMWLVDPRVVAAANLVAQKPLGRTFQITVTVGNANSQTYSLGYTMIPC